MFNYAAMLPSFAVGSCSLAAVQPLVLNVFCKIWVPAPPACTGEGIKSPSNFRARPAVSWDSCWKKTFKHLLIYSLQLNSKTEMPLPLISLPSTCSGSCPEYLTSLALPPALRNAYNYLATRIWLNFHYFSSHKTCIGWMEWQAPSSCKSQHGPLLKISVSCQSQPKCFGFSQQWTLWWRMCYLYLTGKPENWYLYPQGYTSNKNIWALARP